MNNQEIFDKVVGHMRAQGNPWGNFEKRGWMFVNPNNPCERCAVGILSEVELNFFGQYERTMGSMIEWQDNALADSLQFIFELRPVHTWETEFETCAKRYNLVYTPPKEVIKHEQRQENISDTRDNTRSYTGVYAGSDTD